MTLLGARRRAPGAVASTNWDEDVLPVTELVPSKCTFAPRGTKWRKRGISGKLKQDFYRAKKLFCRNFIFFCRRCIDKADHCSDPKEDYRWHV